MSSQVGQISTLGKRKEREGSDGFKRPPQKTKPEPISKPSLEPKGGNRLLAGYLAQEFLTKGTLFGQQFDPAKPKPALTPTPGSSSYADVACLLKGDGAHIPGIVNPTQLGRWLQKRDWSTRGGQ